MGAKRRAKRNLLACLPEPYLGRSLEEDLVPVSARNAF
jgi:hypothetical protein